MEGEKTFYNIAELSRQTDEEIIRICQSGNIQASTAVLMIQSRVQLSISQQLSVISGTLSDLLALCKAQDTKKSKK